MSLTKKSCNGFVEVLASGAPVPGGGGASALVGAIGMALGNMVGNLTVGKKKYADVEAEIIDLMETATELQTQLLWLVDEDATAFEPLAKAYAIPKDDPNRAVVMEDALRTATATPLKIMRACAEAMDVIEEFAEKGSALAISDAGAGAVLCKAALQAASLNVFINTKSIRNREYAAAIEAEADALLDEYVAKADGIHSAVVEKLRRA
jgi:formiminotetrahydrofolate cyclodeaminase